MDESRRIYVVVGGVRYGQDERVTIEIHQDNERDGESIVPGLRTFTVLVNRVCVHQGHKTPQVTVDGDSWTFVFEREPSGEMV